MRKYPVGIQDFSEVRNNGYLYVDKTLFIDKLFQHGKYYFLSRPRRFGKSLFLSTLEYLFQSKQELFEGLYIYDRWDWSKTSPVIKISFSNIGHKLMGLEKAIDDKLEAIALKYQYSFSSKTIDQKFKELIEALSAKHGHVAILIDEYDKPIIDYLGIDTAKAIENREMLKAFYSILKDADPHIKLVFITGVSKFSRVSIFSDLNNLKDLTIDSNFKSICGISQDELEHDFSEEMQLSNREKIKKWYNGYSWDGKSTVYNPFSLLNFFAGDGQYRNYWFETGTPTFLINLSKNQELYDFEGTQVSANEMGAYDLEQLQVLPLMFQTGYLTIKNYKEEDNLYELGYPNEEVRQSYLEMLMKAYSYNQYRMVLATELRNALKVADLKKVESIINTVFKSIPYEIWQKENEHFYHAIIHLTFRLLGIYIESQVQTSDGRMDALVQTQDYVYAFEFKLDGSATEALQQVKNKGYLIPYLHQNNAERRLTERRPICIGVGVNFSTETKKIQEILWEEIV